MKKTMIGLALCLAVLFAFCFSCSGVKSGAAAGEALIKLLPKGSMGVMAIDIHRALTTEAATKALQDPKAKEKYDEFVKMSGIDPMKDISYLGVGISAAAGGGEPEGGIILSLKYDQARLQGLIKEKAPEAREELYNGVTIYSQLDGQDAKQTTQAAFLDPGHIVLGSEKGVKGIIDVYQKKADSIVKDAALAAALKKVDKSAIAWGAFAVPPDLLKKGIASNPQLKVLEGVQALTMAFDYRLAAFVADIQAHGGTKEQNANLASTLNGFKGLGAMFAAQEPVVAEALNGIEITSGENYTRLAINLPQDVITKLGDLAKAKAGEFIKVKKDEPAGEIK
jgi:Protein of unknown function (DUF3352)